MNRERGKKIPFLLMKHGSCIAVLIHSIMYFRVSLLQAWIDRLAGILAFNRYYCCCFFGIGM